MDFMKVAKEWTEKRIRQLASAKVLLRVVKRVRWSSRTDADKSWGIISLDVSITPGDIMMLKLVFWILDKVQDSNAIDFEHPVFQYLQRQLESNQPAGLTVNVRIKERRID